VVTPVILTAQETEIRRITVRNPAWINSPQDPVSTTTATATKRTGGVVQDVDPEFKPQYHQKKKKSSIN
jgi:hypothetical protein